MNKCIVTQDNKTIRALARQTLSGRWIKGFLVLLLAAAAGSLPSYVITSIFPNSDMALNVAYVYFFLITGPINLSVMNFFLRTFRQEDFKTDDLKFGFVNFRYAMGLYFNIYIRVLLWSFLFIIPGIIAAIRYSQSFFILADDPLKSPSQCLYESCAIMEGNKAAFAKLILSFAGWIILAMLPQYALELYLTAPEGTAAVADAIIKVTIYGGSSGWGLLCEVLPMILNIYIYSALACFFELASGKLAIVREGGAEDNMKENEYGEV